MKATNQFRITQAGFFQRFVERHQNRPDRPFCFILGAGASKQSGIPTGHELSRKWIKEYFEENNLSKLTFNEWLKSESMKLLGSDNFDLGKAGEYYSKIYHLKFGNRLEDGYACIEKIMEQVKPSYGYYVLAHILSSTQHKIVITTNFDNLVADAIFLHSETFPMIVGHDGLVDYIKPHVRRPLIAKIHGDRGFATKNMHTETNSIPVCWEKPLIGIFETYTPVVIGYGGNDGSLMGILDALPEGKPDTIYWCYMHRNWPGQKIVELVKKKNGYFIEIEGFDEFMLRLQVKAKDSLKLPDLLQKLKQRTDSIVLNFKEQREKLLENIAEDRSKNKSNNKNYESKSNPNEVSESEENLLSVASKTIGVTDDKKPWWKWLEEINNETDIEHKKEILESALKEWPKNTFLIGEYAKYYEKIMKDYDEAEKYYKLLIEVNPNDSLNLNYYAVFLKNVRKDYDEAEKFYKLSIETDPNDSHNLFSYAVFLSQIRKDYDEAEKYFKLSIEADPNDSINLISYAVFLREIRKDYDKAEKYFKIANELISK